MPSKLSSVTAEPVSCEQEESHATTIEQPLLELLTYRPPAVVAPEDAEEGILLIGRKISVIWTDGNWFDAVVVCFYTRRGKYRIVYTVDGSIELIRLEKGRWRLYPKEKPSWRRPDLVGATVQFMQPEEQVVHKAIVFKHDETDNVIHVAYLRERVTDSLHGGEWAVVKESPCVDRNPS